MNTYILIGMGIGLVVTLILIKYVFRRDRITGSRSFQNISLLMGNEELKNRVRGFLAREKKIDAVKYVHDNYKTGLLEAKNFVEAVEKNTPSGKSGYQSPYDNIVSNAEGDVRSAEEDRILFAKIEVLLKNNHKIEAIKILNEAKKMRLSDAKDIVEAVERKLNKNL